jgi:hypothetical protein
MKSIRIKMNSIETYKSLDQDIKKTFALLISTKTSIKTK